MDILTDAECARLAPDAETVAEQTTAELLRRYGRVSFERRRDRLSHAGRGGGSHVVTGIPYIDGLQ